MTTPKVNQELLRKYASGKCTEMEKTTVESWYNQKAASGKTPPSLKWEDIEHTDLHFQNIFKGKLLPKRQTISYRFTFLRAAAAIFLLAGLSFLVYRFQQGSLPTEQAKESTASFTPGVFQANIQRGEQKIETFSSEDALDLQHQAITEPLTVSTSTGQEYELMLPDGTQVFLNAQSKVLLAPDYNLHNREVRLEGEAYFKVAKNKNKPFVVHVANAEVEALGTEFNIRYYSSENYVFETFLKVGAVRLKRQENEIIMEPGDSYTLNTQTGQDKLQKSQEGRQQLAWKEGYFEYNNTPLVDIVQELARWYNFEYEIDPAYQSKTLSGKIARKQPFQEILTILQFSGIPYQMQNNRLIITTNK